VVPTFIPHEKQGVPTWVIIAVVQVSFFLHEENDEIEIRAKSIMVIAVNFFIVDLF
jgi:hypothetical protein